jgi:hypothetical protein
MDTPVSLSKTRLLSGCQCPLRLWFDVYRPRLAEPPDEGLQAVFERGREVGELARRRWPGGVTVGGNPRRSRTAFERTRELMADPDVPAIYEAAIAHRGVMTRVDVLARAPGGAWDLVEVKSATRVKEPFDLDVAVQYWILQGAGLDVRRAGLLVLNRDYVYPGGELDLDALFRFEDLTENCQARLGEIGEMVAELRDVMALAEPPDIPIGDHCFTPYECPYYAHCSRDAVLPEYPIDILPHLKGRRREGLVVQGIEAVEDIPDDYELTETQARVRQCVLTGRPWISDGLRPALENMDWPLHALDFEAAGFAIPRFAGTRPYDAIPFQFSCHVQHAPGETPAHAEFLAEDGGDPRESLARALLDAVAGEGSILVYSGYESRIIGDLAAWLPHLAGGLEALRPRLVDLLKILEHHYCHPEFRGSWSIKAVLPVLVPEMRYDDMAISDGQAAAREWMQMIDGGDWVRRQQTVQALLEYCRQDSLAMLKLREALLGEAGESANPS